jgi:phospholipid-binding lipoprotein MlaA
VRTDVQYTIDIYDPWEGFNRTMYNFNSRFDEYVFLPVVSGYEAITPDYVEDRISSFFSNLDDIRNLLNSLFQLKGETTLKTTARFLINSTIGIAGFWDHATDWGLPQQREDFGQTLGHYGVGDGPYLVLPIFGPSNLRDTSGLVVDKVAQFFYLYVPTTMSDNPQYGLPFSLLNSVDTRHKINFRYFQTGSPFEYDLVRLLYQRTRGLEIEK